MNAAAAAADETNASCAGPGDTRVEPAAQSSFNCAWYSFVFYTVVIGSVCVLGVVGNVTSIVVLQRDKTNKVATFLLKSLAVADSLVLVVSLGVMSLVYGPSSLLAGAGAGGGARQRTAISYIVKYAHPLGYMTQTATIWMTVLLAVNRFIAVCRPLSASSVCTLNRAKLQVLVVALFSVAYNAPRFWQYSISVVERNGTREHRLQPTAIGEHTTFGKVYTNALYSALVLLLPLVVIVVLNVSLIRQLRAVARARVQIVCGRARAAGGEETNISVVMVIIVVVFIVCHVPDRVLQVARLLGGSEPAGCHSALHVLSGLCTLLIVLNSSTNFLIYYIWRRRFRRLLIMQLRRCGACSRPLEAQQSLQTTYQMSLLRPKSQNSTE